MVASEAGAAPHIKNGLAVDIDMALDQWHRPGAGNPVFDGDFARLDVTIPEAFVGAGIALEFLVVKLVQKVGRQ